MNEPLLQISGLEVTYRGRRRSRTQVLHGVDLTLAAGQTHGLVGESGSGKTTIGRAVLGLAPVTGGQILLQGRPIHALGGRARRALSRQVQVVFQDPYTSLNPALTIGDTLAEPLLGQGLTRRQARAKVGALLERTGLAPGTLHRYPREFSGGQRQRIAIARAIAISPRLIVCDEAVSALDLSTQRTVLDLFRDVQEETGVAYLFISHDLAVIRYLCEDVSVLRGGRIVEQGTVAEVTEAPIDPYTLRLLLSAPVADPDAQRVRRALYEEHVEGGRYP